MERLLKETDGFGSRYCGGGGLVVVVGVGVVRRTLGTGGTNSSPGVLK